MKKPLIFSVFIVAFIITVSAQNIPEMHPVSDKNSGLIGYHLEDNTVVLKPQFCSASSSIDGYYVVSIGEHVYENGIRKNEHIPDTDIFAVLNNTGEFIINFESHFDHIFLNHGLIEVGKQGLYGMVNYKNEVLIPMQYESLAIQNNLIIIAEKNSKSGVLASDGNIIIPLIYDEVLNYTTTSVPNQFYVLVSINGKTGVLNESNTFLIELGLYDIKFITAASLAIKKGDYYYLVDYSLKPILNGKFTEMTLLGVNKSEIYAERNGFMFYYDTNGKLLSKEKWVKPRQ